MTTDHTPLLTEWTTPADLPDLATFTAGQTQYRKPFCDDLAGVELDMRKVEGGLFAHAVFSDEHLVTIAFDGQAPRRFHYDATEIRDGIYLVDILDQDWPADDAAPGYPVCATWALDLTHGVATIAVSAVVAVPNATQGLLPRARTRHEHWRIAGSEGDAHPRSTGMSGYRVRWEYSETDSYDHVYLNGSNFAWQCLRGVERGLSEMDRTRAYLVAPDLYFFHWTENVVVVETAMFVDLAELRSYGRMYGLDENTRVITHHQFGAHGTLLSRTPIPDFEADA